MRRRPTGKKAKECGLDEADLDLTSSVDLHTWLLRSPGIRGTPYRSDIGIDELIVSVDYGKQHNRKKSLIVVIQASRIFRMHDSHMFTVQRPQAMQHLPSRLEGIGNLLPLMWGFRELCMKRYV